MRYSISEKYCEERDCTVYVVKLLEKVDNVTLTVFSNLAKVHTGDYNPSGKLKGFIFETEEDAREFADSLEYFTGDVEDFYDDTEELADEEVEEYEDDEPDDEDEPLSREELIEKLRTRKYIFRKNGKYGIMNFAGEVIHDAIYNEYETYCNEGLIFVRKGKLYGFIDTESAYAIEPQFTDTLGFSDGLAAVKSKGYDYWYYINKNGQMAIPPIYDEICSFCNGRARIKVDDKYGYIDMDGILVIPPTYEKASMFFNHSKIAFASYGNYATSVINEDGEITCHFSESFITDDGNRINDELHIVRNQDYYYGLISTKNGGRITIPLRYRHLSTKFDLEASSTYLVAVLKDKAGILSLDGKLLLPFEFDDIKEIDSLKVIVEKEGKTGVVCLNKKWLVEPSFEEIGFGHSSDLIVREGAFYGILELPDKWKMVPELDSITRGHNTDYIISINGKYGIVDFDGHEILKPTFENIFAEEIEGMDVYIARLKKTVYILDCYGKEIHSFPSVVIEYLIYPE